MQPSSILMRNDAAARPARRRSRARRARGWIWSMASSSTWELPPGRQEAAERDGRAPQHHQQGAMPQWARKLGRRLQAATSGAGLREIASCYELFCGAARGIPVCENFLREAKSALAPRICPRWRPKFGSVA